MVAIQGGVVVIVADPNVNNCRRFGCVAGVVVAVLGVVVVISISSLKSFTEHGVVAVVVVAGGGVVCSSNIFLRNPLG